MDRAPPEQGARVLRATAPVDLRALFEQLVDLDAAGRARRLREWALDRATVLELTALLEGDARRPPLLQMPASAAAERWHDSGDLVAAYLDSRIGPFRIVELLGQGGSSVVFRAERESGGARQVVALKLLRSGLYSAEAQRRFAREHAILAQLSHPHIARLIEGGVSDVGVPYIAMELVEGTPITTHADARGLALRERVALMLTLCRAIEAAHAALVVHRDLKPSNVYVDAHGGVKVLDFGTAKLLDDDRGYTRTDAIILTPAYAAPEQFKSGAVGTAADVYALGVLLGELLTGRLLGAAASVRASVAVTAPGGAQAPRGLPEARHLARALRGDLDAIIATALAEEPGRRYRSAGALADDLERYLGGRAVQAHPPSRWYHLRKFGRRHRHAVASGALLLAGLLVALAAALWQAGVARRAAADAAAESARANAMRDFMFDAFALAEPGAPRAVEPTVGDVVERAIDAASRDRAGDPRARAELLVRLAQVLDARGRSDRAEAVLASVQRDADVALARDDPLRREIDLASIYNQVERGRLDEARRACDRLLAVLPAGDAAMAIRAHTESATIASRQRDLARAERDAREALRRARAHGDPRLLDGALRALGSTLLEADRGADAVAIFEESLRLKRARHGDVHATISADEDALARAYRRAGDLARAEQHARAAIAIDAQALPADHPRRALHMNGLVMVLYERRAFDEALPVLQEVVRIQRAAAGDPDNLASNYGSLGQVQFALGEHAAALATARLALDFVARGSGDRSRLAIRLRMNLGYMLAASGERAAGEAQLDRALADLRASPRPEPELVATVLERSVRSALDAGDVAAARARFEAYADAARAVRDRPNWPGREPTLHAELLLAEARILEARAALDAAEREFGAGVRTDPVATTAHALLRALAAPGDSMLDARAREKLATLPYPPPHLQRLAAAGLR